MSFARSACLSVALAVLVPGCFLLDSPDGVRGAGGAFPDNDDDDDGGYPNPYEACYVMWDWFYEVEPAMRGHRLYVAAMTEDWRTGTLAFGDGPEDPVAVFFYESDFATGTLATYLSTNGQASVDAYSNSLGEPIHLSIDSPPVWSLVAGTGGVATGGTGDADVFLNDVDDCFGSGYLEDCLAGSGSVSIAVGTTNLVIGESSTPGTGVAFAFCQDLYGFSGTLRERALQSAMRREALRTITSR